MSWQMSLHSTSLTMANAIDAMCHILGEFAEVSARVTTRIEMWKHAVTGDDFPVDAPDTTSRSWACFGTALRSHGRWRVCPTMQAAYGWKSTAARVRWC